MASGIRWRLGAMMFLQYAIPGAFAPVAYIYWLSLGFSNSQIVDMGILAGVIGLVSPLVGGQIADRWVPTQYYLAAANIIGGAILILMGISHHYMTILLLTGAYALLVGPTGPLTNSLAFHHLKDAAREFGAVRVWGTVGWIVAGLGLTLWRHVYDAAFTNLLAGFRFDTAWLRDLWGLWWSPSAGSLGGDLFFLAGGCSMVLGLFSLALPSTPPARQGVNPLAFLEALKLVKDRNFAIFLAIAFVVTTELSFYYTPTSGFLRDLGIAEANVPSVMTVAQVAEIFVLALLLPLATRKIGLKWTLALGVIAWPLRYVIFAIGQPLWLVVAALAFHGFGFAFFFVASQIYVNNVAHSDIRASAQSLLAVALGVGGLLGGYIFNFVINIFTYGPARDVWPFMTPVYAAIKVWLGTDTGPGTVTEWTYLFLFPCALTSLCAAAYLVLFKPPREQLAAETTPA